MSTYNDNKGNSGGQDIASILTAGYKLQPNLGLIGRFGMIKNNPPLDGPNATSYTNPLIGAIYSHKLSSEFKLGFFLGITLPVGSGGGNYPNSSVTAANSVGILSRSAMDNALFATNYLTIIPGLDLAYTAYDFTIQLEATLLQLTRTKGEQIDKDVSKTNFTSGLALGYTFTDKIAGITELRYQRWIDNVTVKSAPKPALENLSLAIGPRFTYKLESVTLKPGIAFVKGLSGPIANGEHTYPTNSYKTIFLDVPINF